MPENVGIPGQVGGAAAGGLVGPGVSTAFGIGKPLVVSTLATVEGAPVTILTGAAAGQVLLGPAVCGGVVGGACGAKMEDWATRKSGSKVVGVAAGVATGAVTGAITGALVGSLLGPGGMAAGAVVGGIAGAIGALVGSLW